MDFMDHTLMYLIIEYITKAVEGQASSLLSEHAWNQSASVFIQQSFLSIQRGATHSCHMAVRHGIRPTGRPIATH
eukprot:1140250-Pelagomonas_calceolata.AAC.5